MAEKMPKTNSKTKNVKTYKNTGKKQVAKSTKKSAPKKGTQKNRTTQKKPIEKLNIIPLGGLGEIGKNITAYEYKNDIFLVDCGMAFPDEETPGVDIVIPDFR